VICCFLLCFQELLYRCFSPAQGQKGVNLLTLLLTLNRSSQVGKSDADNALKLGNGGAFLVWMF